MNKQLISICAALVFASCVDLDAPDGLEQGASPAGPDQADSPAGPDGCTWGTVEPGWWYVDCGAGDSLVGRCDDDPDPWVCKDMPPT